MQATPFKLTESLHPGLPLSPLLTDKMEIKTFNQIPLEERFTTGWDLYSLAILTRHIQPTKDSPSNKLWLVECIDTIEDKIREHTGIESIPQNLLRLFPLFNYPPEVNIRVEPTTDTPLYNAYLRRAVYMSDTQEGSHYLLNLMELLLTDVIKEFKQELSKLNPIPKVVSYGLGFYIVESENPPNIEGYNTKGVDANDCTTWFIDAFWSRVQTQV